MVDHIANDVGGFKATAEEILRSEMTDGAKLAAIAELIGATSATDVAKTLNKPLRTVERHYAELRRVRKSAGTQICGTTQNCVPEVRKSAEPGTQICVVASHARPESTTRATKELPSEVLCYEDTNTPSSVPPKPKQLPSARPRASAQRGSRLSPDWTLPEDWRQWSLMNFVHASETMIAAEADQFRDFWISKTGHSATKLDWQATWRNWCRNSKTLGAVPRSQPINTGRMAWDEQKAAKRAQFLAMARGEATNVQ